MEELNDKLVETETVVEEPVDKFITGFIMSNKSKETAPNDSVLLNIPSLSTSKSILSATPSKSKSVGQTDTVNSLDSNCCIGSVPHCFWAITLYFPGSVGEYGLVETPVLE